MSKAGAIFGNTVVAKLLAPKSSADWSIDDFLKKGDNDNVVLQTFGLADTEIVDIRRCFEETTHIFAFGRNAEGSVLQIALLVFLYNGCPQRYTKWLKLDDLRQKYKDNRVYKRHTPLKIKIDDFNASGYLVKMSIDDVNPATKSCIVGLNFVLDQEV